MTLAMGVTMANNPGMTIDQIVDYARLAERLGYESFWLTEDNIRDVFVVLDRVARETERIRIGTGITNRVSSLSLWRTCTSIKVPSP